jgi:hypothetical protein
MCWESFDHPFPIRSMKLADGLPRCAKSVPRRATRSRNAGDAATHLGLTTWTYRLQCNRTRPGGRVRAALHTSGRRFDIVRAHEGSAGRTV